MSRVTARPSEYGWFAFGVLLFALIGYVVASFVGVFVFGLFLYYSTRPVYRRIVARTGHPTAAAAISLFVLALPALAVIGYAVAIAIREIQALEEIPGIDLGTYPGVNDLLENLEDPQALFQQVSEGPLTGDLSRTLVEGLGSAADTALVLGVVLIQLFVMIVVAFYLLRDDRRLAAWVLETFDDRDGTLTAYLLAVDYDLRSIFFGNILNAFVIGAIGALTYYGLNVVAPAGVEIPAAALLGLLAGVASLIPVVGMKLVYVPVAIYLGLRSSLLVGMETLWFVGAFLLVSFVVVDTIPDLLLRPYVSGRSLHVGAVMLAYTLGPLLFGWYGLFLLPILLVLVVQFARVVLPAKLGNEEVSVPAVDPYLVGRTDRGPAPEVGAPVDERVTEEERGDETGDEPGDETGDEPGDEADAEEPRTGGWEPNGDESNGGEESD
ncbi:MAG: AI-2E family transporter [Haloferacaceae archaeon]